MHHSPTHPFERPSHPARSSFTVRQRPGPQSKSKSSWMFISRWSCKIVRFPPHMNFLLEIGSRLDCPHLEGRWASRDRVFVELYLCVAYRKGIIQENVVWSSKVWSSRLLNEVLTVCLSSVYFQIIMRWCCRLPGSTAHAAKLPVCVSSIYHNIQVLILYLFYIGGVWMHDWSLLLLLFCVRERFPHLTIPFVIRLSIQTYTEWSQPASKIVVIERYRPCRQKKLVAEIVLGVSHFSIFGLSLYFCQRA